MAQKKKARKIETKPDWCKGCNICVSFCPKKCLGLDSKNKIQMLVPEDCIKCGICEDLCPDFAIFLIDDEDKKADKDVDNA